MLKFTLLIGAIALATPTSAQTMTGGTPNSPAQPMAQTESSPQSPSSSTVQGNPAAATAQQPVTGAQVAQVAQVVDAEFPGYDKNGDNLLSTSEFGAWMVALKTQSDPTTVAAAPETRKWVDGAFAQADADKNKMLTKTELTRFLTQAG